jgi:hypothetical protein
LKPWDQFYNYCEMFANTDGSWFQHAQAHDERKLAAWEQAYETAMRSREPYRPPLAGYSTLIAAINGMRNDLRAAHHMPPLEGPAGPWEVIKDRKRALNNRRLDQALGYTDE